MVDWFQQLHPVEKNHFLFPTFMRGEVVQENKCESLVLDTQCALDSA